MPKTIQFYNPSINGIKAQQGTIAIPDMNELFATGGSNEKDWATGSGMLHYVTPSGVKNINLERLGYATRPDIYDLSSGQIKIKQGQSVPWSTTGDVRRAGLEYLKQQIPGFDPSKIAIYNPGDILYGHLNMNGGEGSIEDVKKLYSPTQTGGNLGAMTNIQQTGPGYASAIEAQQAGAPKVASLEPNVGVTANQSPITQIQNPNQGAVAGATYNQAIMPQQTNTLVQPQGVQTPQSSNLQLTVDQQAQTNPNALANQDYINAVFKAYHGRDANAQELTRYATRTVKNAYDEIKGGAPQAGIQAPAGMTRIENPATLEQLTAMAGFDPNQITRVGNQLFRPSNFSVNGDKNATPEDFNYSRKQIQTGTLSDRLNASITDAASNYSAQFITQIPNSFDEARTAYWNNYLLNANFRTDLLNSLDSKYQIDEKSAQLTELDKQIASKNQAWNTLLEDNRNAPVSMARIVGQEAHIKRMASIEMEGLQGQRDAIAGDIDRSNQRIQNAYNAAVGDYQDRVQTLKDFYNEQKEFFTKAEDRAYQAKIQQQQNDFELYKDNLNSVRDLMMKYPTSGISMNDSLDSAVTKTIPAYLADLQIQYQKTDSFQFIEGKDGQNYIFNKNTGQYETTGAGSQGVADGTTEQKIIGLGLNTIDINGRQVTGNVMFTNLLAQADADMKAAGLKGLDINQDYRTAAQQASIYAQLSKTGGRVALPGTSFHEKGLAADITNWKEAAPYLSKYGIVNGLKDDMGHFSLGEMNPDIWAEIAKSNPNFAPTLPTAVATLKDKWDLLNKIKTQDKGLKATVGPSTFSRLLYIPRSWSGQVQEFVSDVDRLTSKETLDTLVNLKQQGGTLGALSEKELKVLEGAATNINGWKRTDEKGNVYYNVNEKTFLSEINRIQDLTRQALERAGYGDLANNQSNSQEYLNSLINK